MRPMSDIEWMQKAIALARKAETAGEVPVGALVVHDGKLLGVLDLDSPVLVEERLLARRQEAAQPGPRLASSKQPPTTLDGEAACDAGTNHIGRDRDLGAVGVRQARPASLFHDPAAAISEKAQQPRPGLVHAARVNHGCASR